MLLTVILVICSILSAGLVYLAHPALSLVSSALPWTILGISAIFAIGLTIWNCVKDASSLVEIIPWSITGVLLVFVLVVSLIGAPVFNFAPYRDAITIESGNFKEDFVDISKTVAYSFMDLDTAQRVGDRVLGSVPNASWYNVSQEYNLINYQGHQYRVSPLEYRDLFAYLKAKSKGIPGYVLVDVDTMESKYVQTENPIMVSTSGKFSQNLGRVLRGQFPNLVFEKSFMEIDDTGYPYWITATVEAHAGLWGAPVVMGYVITDACTTESKYYDIEAEKPDWLDHIYSLEYMMTRAEWHYGLVNGWWNFSKEGVMHTTWNYRQKASAENGTPAFYGYNCVQGIDGNIKVFTGLTPANRTESNVGFLMIDCVTGKYIYYNIPGAEESSAQSVVEGIIQQMGYEATFPVMTNIAGHPSYLMNLKDKSGLIKKYAIVNYENYSQAYVDDTLQDTIKNYMVIIGEDEGEPVIEEEPVEILQKTGVITKKLQADIDGTTVYYYELDNNVGVLYKVWVTTNESEVMYCEPGTTVKISYEEGKINLITEIERQ